MRGTHAVAGAVTLGLALGAGAGCGDDASSGGAATKSTEPIKIGFVGSMTGAFASLGTMSANGAKLAVKQINDAGGVGGRKLELTVLDDQTSPTSAVSAVNRLIANGVVAIAGFQTQATSTPVLPIIARKKVLTVLSSGMPAKPTVPTVFSTTTTVQMYGQGVACYVSKVIGGTPTVAYVNTSDPGTQVAADTFKEDATKAGMKVLSAQTVPPGATDVTVAASKTRDAKPDVIVNFAAGPTGALFAKTVRDLGMDQPIVAYVGLANTAVLKTQGKALDGMLVESFIAGSDPLPAQAKFATQFTSAYDLPPDNQAVNGYDTIQTIAEALKKVPNAGQADGAKLAKALEGASFRGMTGTQAFEPFVDGSVEPHTGPGVDDFVWLDVKNGSFERAAKQPDGCTSK